MIVDENINEDWQNSVERYEELHMSNGPVIIIGTPPRSGKSLYNEAVNNFIRKSIELFDEPVITGEIEFLSIEDEFMG